MTPSITRRIVVALAFASLVAASHLGVLWLASRIRYGELTLLHHLTHNPLTPGGRYQSLRRFREAEAIGEVDIVFLGSSHSYRAFDPRFFAARDHRTQNLGSSNQTPLNSRYLAERYLPALSPELLIIEVYFPTLDNDGLESFRDLVVNTRWSWELMEMAVATRKIDAFNYALARGLGWLPDPTYAQQQSIAGEDYVAGGYCETTARRNGLTPRTLPPPEVQPAQLAQLVATSRLGQSLGAKVLWVTHPWPEDYQRSVTGYDAVRRRIEAAGEAIGVDHWDYNRLMTLDALTYFSDFHHLNAAGVLEFNTRLYDDLKREGYLR